jgi:hypothetical protein
MSIKLSDLTAAKNKKFPDFILDAEDEEGTTLELHFRPSYVLDEELRVQMGEVNEKYNDAQGDEGLRELCIETMRISARDPYHFELLEKYIADNTDEGDVDLPLWITVVELYRKQTQLGEA